MVWAEYTTYASGGFLWLRLLRPDRFPPNGGLVREVLKKFQGNLRLVKYYSVWPDAMEPDFHGKIVSSLNIHSRLVWVRYDWTTKKHGSHPNAVKKPQEVWLDVGWASNSHGFFLNPTMFPKRLRTVFGAANAMPLVHVSILIKIQQANSMFPKSCGPKHMLFSIYFLSNF